MKVSNRSRFPHPVLWSESGDYPRGIFQVEFDGQESLATGAVTLKYSGTLDQPDLALRLTRKEATTGVFVSCLETYYSRLIPITLPAGQFVVPAGLLRGRVILRPVIWTTGQTTLDRLDDIHPEFGRAALPILKHGLLAIADEEIIEIGREKLARIESIFALAVNDEVPLNQFALLLDDEKIQILAARQTYEKIFRLRATSASLAILLNSVYLPSVINVLSSLRGAPEEYAHRRWHRIFAAKLRHLEINVESDDVLEAAQRILNSPFSAIPDDLDIHT